MPDQTNAERETRQQEDVHSKPSPAENDVPDDKGAEEIEEYGSRTDESSRARPDGRS
jgi:hypothetical protein